MPKTCSERLLRLQFFTCVVVARRCVIEITLTRVRCEFCYVEITEVITQEWRRSVTHFPYTLYIAYPYSDSAPANRNPEDATGIRCSARTCALTRCMARCIYACPGVESRRHFPARDRNPLSGCSAKRSIAPGPTPHFLIVSNATEKDARNAVRQFEAMRSLFQRVFPDAQLDTGSPMVLGTQYKPNCAR